MGRQNTPDSPAQVDTAHLFSLVTFALPLTAARMALGGGARDESAPSKNGLERQPVQRLVHADGDVEAPSGAAASRTARQRFRSSTPLPSMRASLEAAAGSSSISTSARSCSSAAGSSSASTPY